MRSRVESWAGANDTAALVAWNAAIMADTNTTIADSAAATERDDAPAPRHTSLGGTKVPFVSLDETLAQELGDDEEAPPPRSKQVKRARSDDDEDDDHDEDEEDTSDDDEEQDSEDDEDDDSDADEEEDDESEEADEESDEDSDDDEEESEDDEEDEESDESAEEEAVPKGMEDLAKDKKFGWAAKRIQKQSKDINILRSTLAQGAVVLTPTKEFPLVNATTDDKLKAIVSEAKDQLKILSALKPEDFQENDSGEMTVVLKENGKRVVKTDKEVAEEIKALEAKTDEETISRQRAFNQYRQENRPWEAAQAVCPEMFQPGTVEERLYRNILAMDPAFKATIGDHELIAANAISHLRKVQDTTPTKDYPKGKKKWILSGGKWVSFDLDKKGKLKTPKRAEQGGEQRKPLLKRKPLVPPSGARPAQKTAAKAGQAKASKAEAERLMREKPSEANLERLVAAELG